MINKAPKQDELYKKSDGSIIIVKETAKHFKTGDDFVIYADAEDTNELYVIPLETFKSEYELVDEDAEITEEDVSDSPMLRFLDTDDFDEKYEILSSLKKDDITDTLINNLAVTLDVVIPDGPIEKRFAELKTCVKTRKKYESLRLR